jgi:hypothetical protein
VEGRRGTSVNVIAAAVGLTGEASGGSRTIVIAAGLKAEGACGNFQKESAATPEPVHVTIRERRKGDQVRTEFGWGTVLGGGGCKEERNHHADRPTSVTAG